MSRCMCWAIDNVTPEFAATTIDDPMCWPCRAKMLERTLGRPLVPADYLGKYGWPAELVTREWVTSGEARQEEQAALRQLRAAGRRLLRLVGA